MAFVLSLVLLTSGTTLSQPLCLREWWLFPVFKVAVGNLQFCRRFPCCFLSFLWSFAVGSPFLPFCLRAAEPSACFLVSRWSFGVLSPILPSCFPHLRGGRHSFFNHGTKLRHFSEICKFLQIFFSKYFYFFWVVWQSTSSVEMVNQFRTDFWCTWIQKYRIQFSMRAIKRSKKKLLYI